MCGGCEVTQSRVVKYVEFSDDVNSNKSSLDCWFVKNTKLELFVVSQNSLKWEPGYILNIKTLFIALSGLLIGTLPSVSEDYQNIPSSVKKEIKSKCVSQFPDDYFMQSGCIKLQSDSYIEVHGNEGGASNDAPEIDLTGIPSAFDKAQMNNAAYLSVVKKVCKIEVGKMPEQYRERAVASDRLNAVDVDSIISSLADDDLKKAKRNSKIFCAEAKRNFKNFDTDLEN